MNRSVIIVAGGTGSRMNAGVPKQFLLLAGKPVLMHSLLAFHSVFPEIKTIVALPADQFPRWQELCTEYGLDVSHTLVAGGETRFHSVKNALSVVDDTDGVVAIHDGARPLVPGWLIRQSFLTAAGAGSCIPVVPVNESLRIVDGNDNSAVDRTRFRVVQTPQVFRAPLIKKAYEQDYREGFTDDATVAESAGVAIHLTDGDPVNIKITYPVDLAAAEMLLRSL